MGARETQQAMRAARTMPTTYTDTVAVGFNLPNLSGDHSAGRVLRTPSNTTDIVNKAYVDAQVAAAVPTFTAGSVIFSNGTTLAQDNANFFWDDTNNRLGIADNTPSFPLDVNGKIRSQSHLIASNFVYLDGLGTSAYIAYVGGDFLTDRGINLNGQHLIATSGEVVFNETGANLDFRVEGDTNANLLFVDASADKIGICTSSPTSILQVNGDNAFKDNITSMKNDLTAGVSLGYLGIQTVGSSNNHLYLDSKGSGSAVFLQTNNTTGRVGIVDTYSAKFSVKGDGGDATCIFRSNASTPGNVIQCEESAGSSVAYITALGGAVFNETGADADFRVEGDTDANTLFVDASTDSVGIGTATPATKLDVNGTVTATAFLGAIDGAIGGTTPAAGIFTTLQAGSITNDTGLAAGTYTPTRSAEANMDANVTMTAAQYMRVGNTVTVSGRFTADPTTTATTTSFEIDLPVASNFANAQECSGVAFCGSIASMGAEIIGVVANDTAKFQWQSTDVTSQTWSYTFTYQVI